MQKMKEKHQTKAIRIFTIVCLTNLLLLTFNTTFCCKLLKYEENPLKRAQTSVQHVAGQQSFMLPSWIFSFQATKEEDGFLKLNSFMQSL